MRYGVRVRIYGLGYTDAVIPKSSSIDTVISISEPQTWGFSAPHILQTLPEPLQTLPDPKSSKPYQDSAEGLAVNMADLELQRHRYQQPLPSLRVPGPRPVGLQGNTVLSQHEQQMMAHLQVGYSFLRFLGV